MADTRRIAIAHKDYAVAGGGELLAERLGLCFDAPVFAGFVNDRNRGELRADVRDLFGQGLSGKLVRRGGLTRQLAYRILWKHPPELHDYDVVIQSGMEPLWYQPRDTQTTVAYVHSTPRCQYDLAPYHWDEPDSVGEWAGTIAATVYNDYVRQNFLGTKNYPDLFVANSDLVARRLERYWNVDPENIRVVYPPTPVDDYGPAHADDQRDTYLSINRLDDWKRIDEIVDAFAGLDARLQIAGKGPAEADLRERAADADNIEFLGYVPEAEKKRLLAEAKAVLYNPLNEDFGMVPIEALASGTPLVAVDDGFQQYQLSDGETAIKYDRAIHDRETTVRNLRAAVRRFEADGVALDADGLQAAVEQYSVDRFEREMQAAVDLAVERTRIEGPAQRGDAELRHAEPALPDGGEDDAA